MFRSTIKNDWVKLATTSNKFERLEAFFTGHGYDPHRHDTYAIGRTLSGIQSFRYRGSLRHSLAGHTMVLHPDELHDGEAGSSDGFHYRMIYVEPSSIQKVLGGQPLPFIKGGISTDQRLVAATESLLKGMDDTFESLEEDDAIYDLANALSEVGGQKIKRRSYDYRAAERAREYINDLFTETITLDTLSLVSGRDRWNLSRDFRMLYGTSPYRYVTMRRLEYCRRLMLTGQDLTDIALIAGFADQSHMTRHFVKTFGISPGLWLKIITKGLL
ncbi:AraC family transcriptional regulator [Brenneria izadpanahii]|uniref:AraC family transcriptional regulator n=1 Tax=Brenneria izadpanahii TaxID=2722756 RepID=A0ABX7UUT9_9GAMM|nr:AraC family transcriptional regulator [Brenneria izadpanahii]QTF07384.1 AraC family transcriptional regulator [Brenneria izadpanahii]